MSRFITRTNLIIDLQGKTLNSVTILVYQLLSTAFKPEIQL